MICRMKTKIQIINKETTSRAFEVMCTRDGFRHVTQRVPDPVRLPPYIMAPELHAPDLTLISLSLRSSVLAVARPDGTFVELVIERHGGTHVGTPVGDGSRSRS